MRSHAEGRHARIVIAFICVICVIVGVVCWLGEKWWLRDDRPVLSRDVVVGTWLGKGGCELTVSKIGTFQAYRLPRFLITAIEDPATISGNGTWEAVPALEDRSGRPTQLLLTFEESDGRSGLLSTRLRSDLVDDELILFWSIGDPDLGNRFILAKK